MSKISKKNKKKKVLIDMTCSLIHHGHTRIIQKASKYGEIYIGLTKDSEVRSKKRFNPEIKFRYRKEILESIKKVKKVIPSNFKITQNFLEKNKIDILVQGSDYKDKRLFKDVKIILFIIK